MHCIELVELDQRIMNLTQEQTQNIKTKAELIDQKSLTHQEKELLHKKVRDTQKALDLLELELKSFDIKVMRTQEKLLSAKNVKESNSLELEMTNLQAKKSELEEQGLLIISDLETAKAVAALSDTKYPENEKILQDKLHELDARQEHVQSLVQTYAKQREQLVQIIPEEFLTQYETMRKRVSNPVVPIINGGCSGCFYGLNRPELIKAEQGSLITCHGCYRLLYIYKAVHDDSKEQHVV